jgi:hypothetical protein
MNANAYSERQRRERLATGPLGVGALGLVLGVMLGLSGQSDLSAALTLSGAALLLWGMHRLGRLGADPPRS